MFSGQDLLLILVIVLVIFGPGKIPQLGEGLGKALREFKRSQEEPDEINFTPKEPGEIPVKE